MYNHNKAQQSKNRVHISWDILYEYSNWSSIKHLFPSELRREWKLGGMPPGFPEMTCVTMTDTIRRLYKSPAYMETCVQQTRI